MFPLATGRSGIKLGARTNNTHLRNVLVKCTVIIFIAICWLTKLWLVYCLLELSATDKTALLHQLISFPSIWVTDGLYLGCTNWCSPMHFMCVHTCMRTSSKESWINTAQGKSYNDRNCACNNDIAIANHSIDNVREWQRKPVPMNFSKNRNCTCYIDLTGTLSITLLIMQMISKESHAHCYEPFLRTVSRHVLTWKYHGWSLHW